MIRLYVGYDPRESAAYHVFCQSVLEKASQPVEFIPLHRPMLAGFDGQRDGTNAFIFSRYLVPYLNDYQGLALFADGDMVVNTDIAALWALKDSMVFDKAVAVVRHDYRTKHRRKYIGSPLENDNIDYPRKNWSSVMLWNCGHYANRILTPDFVRESGGQFLHRFEWLKDEQIGDLHPTWNHLIGEYANNGADLHHYTLGVPGIAYYANCDQSDRWHSALLRALHIEGETPLGIVKRASTHGNHH